MAQMATGYGSSASDKENGRPEPTGVVPVARSSRRSRSQWPATDRLLTGKSK